MDVRVLEVAISFPYYDSLFFFEESNLYVFFRNLFIINIITSLVSMCIEYYRIKFEESITFSHSKMISSPPATLQLGLLNLQITKSDIAFLS